MLSNRFMRLVTTILIFVASVVVCGLVLLPLTENFTGVTLSVFAAFAIGIIHNVCWDLLNFSFLDNLVGKIIKRVIFYCVSFVVILISAVIFFTETGDSGFLELDFIGKGLVASTLPAAVATFVLCEYSDSQYWEFEKGPFIPLIGVGISVIIGLVLGFLSGALFIIVSVAILVIGIALSVFIIRKYGFIYEDSSEDYDSYSSSSYSGGSRSNSNYYDSNDYDEPEQSDNRKSDGFILNQLELSMYRLAKRYSKYSTLSYGVNITTDVYSSTSSYGVDFSISVQLSGGYMKDDYEVRMVSNERDDYLRDLANSLYSDAESEINSLRSQYKDYDHNMSINVRFK